MSNFYNKYNPESFEQVIGQEIPIKILKYLINNSIPNGLLLTGIHGVGKTLLARIFAKAINCKENNKPCEKCDYCIKCRNSQDIIEIDGATYTGVDNIRKVIEGSNYLPLEMKYKVYIIDEVHMLSKSAFDALLMTLQEPPAYVKFIFATTRPEKIPDTFLSRCLTIHLTRISEIQMFDFLRHICQKEKKESISDDVLKVIVDIAEGSVRRSLSLLELLLIMDDNNQISKEETELYFKVFSSDVVLEIMSLVFDGKVNQAIDYWRNLYNKGYDEKAFFHKMSEILNHLALIKLNKMEDFSLVNQHKLKDFLDKYYVSFNLIVNIWDIIINQTEALYMGIHNLVENTIIMISLIDDFTDIDIKIKKTFNLHIKNDE